MTNLQIDIKFSKIDKFQNRVFTARAIDNQETYEKLVDIKARLNELYPEHKYCLYHNSEYEYISITVQRQYGYEFVEGSLYQLDLELRETMANYVNCYVKRSKLLKKKEIGKLISLDCLKN